MQVTLNLDTPEKQAFFLSLVNRPPVLVDVLKKRLVPKFDENGHERRLLGFENFIEPFDEKKMYELLEDIFTFDDWVKVFGEFMKVGYN